MPPKPTTKRMTNMAHENKISNAIYFEFDAMAE